MTSNYNEINIKLQELEQEYDRLQRVTQKIRDGCEDDEKIAALILENTKLKHRLAILNSAIKAEKGTSSNEIDIKSNMISIMNHLENLFSDAISVAYPELKNINAIITLNNNPKFGDYQCNNAIAMSKMLKSKTTPKMIAEEIVKNVTSSQIIDKIDIAPAGFINIFLAKDYAKHAIKSILINGIKPPKTKKQKVIVDFSSPNIAKEMHVGHLRSTIIGDSVSKLMEFLGHDVLRLNHIGDWGTPFGMLIAHMQEIFPDYLTKSPPINDLQNFYKQSKQRFDQEEDFKKRAYDCVVKLQSGEANTKKAWSLICEASRREFQKLYDRLDIKLTERGESFYQSRMESVVKDLETKGFLEADDGRKIMWGKNKNGIPLIVVKSDGGYTYDTSDLTAIKQRIEEEKADWIIYVTDLGQATHFKTIFDCAEVAGILNLNSHRVDHVGFGVVLGEDGKKFKTRSGDTVRLVELLDEGLKRAADKLKEKDRHEVLTTEEFKLAQEAVAYGCIKYTDLSQHRVNDYVFSFDKMLDDKGNTAVYLLYAYARIKSIARNCEEKIAINLNQLIESNDVTLDHEKEWKLAKTLIKFPDVILKITKDLLLHSLCDYAYEVCTTFSEFYKLCYCIEKNSSGEIIKINHGRILLCEATALVLGKCFDILGLKPIEKI